MDFSKAALLVAAIFGITEWVKANVPQIPVKLAGIVALVIGIGVVFLTSATVWADTQVIGEVSLSNLNVASKLLAGLMLGGGASFAHSAFTAISNVGENQD